MHSIVLYGLICLTGLVFGAELVASHFTQSIVLLISAYHMLYNILSLLLLVISHRMSRGKTLLNTFGWARVKVLGLHVNMLLVVALCFSALLEAIQTTVHASHENTTPEHPDMMLALGLMDLGLNLLCFVLIGGYTHHQGCSMMGTVRTDCVITETANLEKCVTPKQSFYTKTGDWCSHRFLDISRDISSCLAVVACSCVLLLMNGLLLKYVDAILAAGSVVILLYTTYPFIRESALILLQSIPSHIDVESLTKRLCAEFPDLLNVHDLHVWRLTMSEVIATAHILLPSAHVYARIKAPLANFFQREGISSATIQPEFSDGSWSKQNNKKCILQCSLNNNCVAFTCCGPMQNEMVETEKEDDTTVSLQFDFSQIPLATETVL